MPMHKFVPTDVDGYLTEEALKNLSVTMPNNDGVYLSREEFMVVDNIAMETAKNILSIMDSIIDNNGLPNIYRD